MMHAYIQHGGYMRRMKLHALRLCSHHCHAAPPISIIKQDSHKGPSVLLAFSITGNIKTPTFLCPSIYVPPPLFFVLPEVLQCSPCSKQKAHTQQSISPVLLKTQVSASEKERGRDGEGGNGKSGPLEEHLCLPSAGRQRLS